MKAGGETERTEQGPGLPPGIRALSFALAMPESGLTGWQGECLCLLSARPDTSLRLVLKCKAPMPAPRERGVQRLLLKRATFPLKGEVPEADDQPPMEIPGNGAPVGDAVRRIGEAAPDFILDFTGGALPAALTGLPRLGTWAFVLGLESGEDSRFPCFTETLKGRRTISGMLYRRGVVPGAGTPLARFSIRNRGRSWRRNILDLFDAAARMPASVCGEIVHGRKLPPETAAEEIPAPVLPTTGEILGLSGRLFAGAARKLHSKLFVEDWNVGLIREPIEKVALGDSGPPSWLFAPSRRFFRADPFAARLNGGYRLFYERYDREQPKGEIAQAEVVAGFARELPGSPHTARHHQSYPYLFTHGGVTYAVPESNASGRVELHRVCGDTGAFHSPVCLLEESLSDVTLFPHENRWWLFGLQKGSRLLAWHGEHPRGPWTPHAANPLKIDPASARPGGTPFAHEGSLYRPAQDCSRAYGGRIGIYRVEALSPACFRETLVRHIDPAPGGPYPDGLHTLSRMGEMTLVDGKRLVFSPMNLLKTLLSKIIG